jgi:hypothetical protein
VALYTFGRSLHSAECPKLGFDRLIGVGLHEPHGLLDLTDKAGLLLLHGKQEVGTGHPHIPGVSSLEHQATGAREVDVG